MEMCGACLLKKIISNQFIQFANNFQLTFRRLFSHPYHDYHDNERKAKFDPEDMELSDFSQRAGMLYEIPHLLLKGTKA